MIWETFNSLFKTIHRQGQRVEELESRVQDLERRLNDRAKPVAELYKSGEIRPLGYYDVTKGEVVVDPAMKGRIIFVGLDAADDAAGEAQRIRQQADALEEDAQRREKG